MTTARSARRTTANLRPQGRLLLRQAARFQPRGGGGQDLEPKDALLLAYLAIEGPTSRAQLAALLWPDADEERARGNLRQRLLRMKRAVGIELVVGTGQAQLAEGIRHDLDDAHELLELVGLDEAGEFAGWLEAQRERRRRGRADALAAAAAKAEAEGDHAAALEHAGALLDFDPLSEDAHRRVMRLHYVRGDAGAALAAYRRCVRILRSELGAEPSRETRELKGQIEKAVPPPPAAKAMPAVPVAILRPPRLIGRAAELAGDGAGLGHAPRLPAAWRGRHGQVQDTGGICARASRGNRGPGAARRRRRAVRDAGAGSAHGNGRQAARTPGRLARSAGSPAAGTAACERRPPGRAAGATAAGHRGRAARRAARRRPGHRAGRPALRRRRERRDAAHDRE